MVDSRGPSDAIAAGASGSDIETRLSTGAGGDTQASRFLPGAMLAGRYRLIRLLGAGGMGEVYQADDLILGQPVALKFASAARHVSDPQWLRRLRGEVSIARRISHPNVCRVYDVGESDGEVFLSMEYIDGEDLASLLRRIGRLPRDKAVQIAWELCAGVQAAHENGVLHRDLKPANVMLDRHGHVKVMDFGLAELVGDTAGGPIAGTPMYMAPERRAGAPATTATDIYALGLVLYEVFTGTRAFAEASPADRPLTATVIPRSPSSVVEDLGPQIDAAVLSCLALDAAARPRSALAVATRLPGYDPLAHILAAGETPSPDIVAASRGAGALTPLAATTWLLTIIVSLAVSATAGDRTTVFRLVPLQRSPDVLEDRAAEMVRAMGYSEPIVDSARGIEVDMDYLAYVADRDRSATRWERLSSGPGRAVFFWYRESPQYLVPFWKAGVGLGEPPHDLPGMRRVVLGLDGQLLQFEAVPSATEPDGQMPMDWIRLFREAGLAEVRFTAVAPRIVPRVYADARAAWESVEPGTPPASIRVEAASYRGRPVYFEVMGPWSKPPGQRTVSVDVTPYNVFLNTMFFLAVVSGVLLAGRNLRAGRGDRAGAFKLSGCVFWLVALVWVFYSHHLPTLDEVFVLAYALVFAFAFAGAFWAVYIALEPAVRRRWPDVLVSWTRVLQGRFRDPLVGRDLLIGGAVGLGGWAAVHLSQLATTAAGVPPPIPPGHPVTDVLLGPRFAFANLAALALGALMTSLTYVLLLVLLGIVLRRRALAVAAFWLIQFVIIGLTLGSLIGFAFASVLASVVTWTVVRRGLLATTVGFYFMLVANSYPVTYDLSTPYVGATLVGVLAMLAIALFGFRAALGSQPVLGKLLADTS